MNVNVNLVGAVLHFGTIHVYRESFRNEFKTSVCVHLCNRLQPQQKNNT